MKLCPRFYEAALNARQLTGYQVDRIDAEDTALPLIVGMEMRRVVTHAGLHEHPDYDAEKPTDLWHVDMIPP